MSKIQDLFVREKDGYFECGFCQTSFFTLIMFKFHLQTKHTSVTQPVELQNPSHIQPPVENSENNKTTNSEKLPKLQNSSLLETVVANNTTKKSEKLPIIVEKQNAIFPQTIVANNNTKKSEKLPTTVVELQNISLPHFSQKVKNNCTNKLFMTN